MKKPVQYRFGTTVYFVDFDMRIHPCCLFALSATFAAAQANQNLSLSPLKVIFVADSLRLDLLRLGRSGNPLVSVIGDLDWICSDIGVASPLPYTADLVSSSTESIFLPAAKPSGLMDYDCH